jgi:GPN-loop GTPase
MNRLMKDLEMDRKDNPDAALRDHWDQEEEDGEDDNGEDMDIIDRSKYSCQSYPEIVDINHTEMLLIHLLIGEEPWPGQYIDLTQTRRREGDSMTWPRPT